jgi:pimeloyl-ACP methyl ester carboxylesterase
MSIEVPVPSETFEVELDDGARIRMRRHGNPKGARLLVTHGNGFAVDAYVPFWQHFVADFDVLAFDFRNHGQNIPVEPSHHHYAQLARDLARVVQSVVARFGPKKTGGIFHSMSARTAMKHAIEAGWQWDALVLVDPPNVPPPDHPVFEPMRIFEEKLVEWARNRRRRFASVAELAEEYRQSRATRGWVPGMHDLMARSVLRRDPSGPGYVLVCAPENEATIYAEALTLNLWPQAEELGSPVKLIGADPSAKGAPATALANQCLAREGGYDYGAIGQTGHLLQIEKPIECARMVREFLAKWGVG